MQARVPALLASISGLDNASRARAQKYLDGFFTDIESDQKAAASILKTCLG
jgi:hypothetical protein